MTELGRALARLTRLDREWAEIVVATAVDYITDKRPELTGRVEQLVRSPLKARRAALFIVVLERQLGLR